MFLCDVGYMIKKIQINQEISYNKYDNIESSLWNDQHCYICGEDDFSIKNSYGKNNTLGIVFLNDLDVIDFDLNLYELENDSEDVNKCRYAYAGRIGETIYMMSYDSLAEESRLHISIPEEYQLDTSEMEKNLCDSCLDKIGTTLEVKKLGKDEWLFPLCLIDFKTLEIYSLQNWNTQYVIRDYQVDITYTEENIIVKTADME